MPFERYRPVMNMVLRKHVGADAERVVADLIQSLEIAEALVGEMQAATPLPMGRATTSVNPERVFDKTSPLEVVIPDGALRYQDGKQQAFHQGQWYDLYRQSGTSLVTDNATTIVHINSSAPPVALQPGQTQADPPPDIDYYESEPGKGDGCQRLRERLGSLLPLSVSVPVEGMAEPLMLERAITSPGLKFVHVSYSIPGDQALGPRITLMTSQRYIDPAAIIRDVTSQAAAVYSKEKRVLVPRMPRAVQPPSAEEMQAALARDRAMQGETPVTLEDKKVAQEWASNRGPKWQ